MSEILTKAEQKARKAQHRLEKELEKIKNLDSGNERWVVCLKYGDKYNADYVNKLYNMTKRHSVLPFRFACMTEDSNGLHPDIQVLSLPLETNLQGWWYKPYVFSSSFPLSGSILFLDLDIVIVKNIDQFWLHEPGKFCIIRDFTRVMNPEWKRFNSSIFRFESGSLPHVWDNLKRDPSIMKRMHGDQDWLFNQITNNFSFWPDNWSQSYKWEIRDRSEIVGVGRDRKFNQIKEPKINPDTSILVFHGDPKPEQVKDPIVVSNWC
jgi:hypothetical protein